MVEEEDEESTVPPCTSSCPSPRCSSRRGPGKTLLPRTIKVVTWMRWGGEGHAHLVCREDRVDSRNVPPHRPGNRLLLVLKAPLRLWSAHWLLGPLLLQLIILIAVPSSVRSRLPVIFLRGQ